MLPTAPEGDTILGRGVHVEPSGDTISPRRVVDDVVTGMTEERFMISTHPRVLDTSETEDADVAEHPGRAQRPTPSALTKRSADDVIGLLAALREDDHLTRQPATFALELQLAAADNPVHDVSAFWPDNRQRIIVGRLEIDRKISLEEIGDPVMMHDPTRVTDGIETHPDDEIMNIRRGAYLASASDRTGGWQRTSPVLAGLCPLRQP